MELINESYIWPTKNMTLNQKLNSVVRGSAILCGGLALLGKPRKIFYLLIFAMLATIFLFYSKEFCVKIHSREYIIREAKMNFIQKMLIMAHLDTKKLLSDQDIHNALSITSGTPQMSVRDAKEVIADAIQNAPASEMKSPDNLSISDQISTISNSPPTDFTIPDDFEWDRKTAHPYDQKTFCGIDQAVEDQTVDRNEILLTYGDRLNVAFEDVLTADFYGKNAQWWRDEGAFLVDRDIYHPKNTDLNFSQF
jgi:hypothetical protein